MPAPQQIERGSTIIKRGQYTYTLVKDMKGHFLGAGRGDGVDIMHIIDRGDHYILNDILHDGADIRQDICKACERQWSQLSEEDQTQLRQQGMNVT